MNRANEVVVTHQMSEPYWATARVGLIHAGKISITFPITQPHVRKVRFSVKKPEPEIAEKIWIEKITIAMCELSVELPLSVLDKLELDVYRPGDFTLDLRLPCVIEALDITLHEVRP